MSKYIRCPYCSKIVMPWHAYCSKCGNNLEYNTRLSTENMIKLEKKLDKYLKVKE